MKKLIAFVLATVCVLGLVGCNNTQPEYEEPSFTEKQTIVSNNYSDFDGISIQASGIYIYPDKTTIVINWRNDTEYSVIYYEYFEIERLENGEWVSCALKDTGFDDVAHVLFSKELYSKGYTFLTGVYEVSKPGTYRFLATCSVEVGERKKTECSLWTEFILE